VRVIDFDNVEILLVEDNPHDAEMLVRALKKHNFLNKLFWVKDGAEALDFLRCTGAYANRDPAELPKLVLLDLKMPKLGGLDVLRYIKADEQSRAIPVLMVTSSNEERDVVECYELGANGFVVKPVEFANFTEAVAKIGMSWLLVNRTPGQ
jgi:two-component system, response regulator